MEYRVYKKLLATKLSELGLKIHPDTEIQYWPVYYYMDNYSMRTLRILYNERAERTPTHG